MAHWQQQQRRNSQLHTPSRSEQPQRGSGGSFGSNTPMGTAHQSASSPLGGYGLTSRTSSTLNAGMGGLGMHALSACSNLMGTQGSTVAQHQAYHHQPSPLPSRPGSTNMLSAPNPLQPGGGSMRRPPPSGMRSNRPSNASSIMAPPSMASEVG